MRTGPVAGSAATAAKTPAAGVPAAMIVTGLLLTFVVPAPLLDFVGFGYSTPTGTPLTKIHPGSDLIVLGVIALAARGRAPLAWAAARCRRFFGTTLFAVTLVFFLAYTVLVIRAPFTPMIETFFVPIFLFLGLVDLAEPWRARLEAGLHAFVAANALLGIVEFVTSWRLIPVIRAGVEQTAELEARASGLMGHPLTSAGMAGLYTAVLMMGGGKRLPPILRAPAFALQLLALAAFGGRTALVMTGVCLTVTGLGAIFRFLSGAKVDLRVAGLAILGAPVVIAAVAVVADGGFFDMVLDRFVDDNGSAHTRQLIFELFRYMSWQDLMLGPDQAYLVTLQNHLGMEAGVENGWLGFLFFCGLLPGLVLLAGFSLFLFDVMRQARPAALVPLLFFIGTVSSAVSLSTKTTMLTHFVAVVMILMPPVAVPSRAARPRLRAPVLVAT